MKILRNCQKCYPYITEYKLKTTTISNAYIKLKKIQECFKNCVLSRKG